jgi:sulfatase modifying factor 1
MSMRRGQLFLGLVGTFLLVDAAVMCTSFSGEAPEATSDGGEDTSMAKDDVAHVDGTDGQAAVDSSMLDAAGRGPPCIAVDAGSAGGFCIDATEITNAQYAAFLQSAERATPPQRCTASINEGTAKLGGGTLPVTNVDWCDAVAYCAWSGKHLCNTPSGMPLPVTLRGDPTYDAWTIACNRGASVPDANAGCNGANVGTRAAVDGQCEILDSGILDLVGNVWEWTDSCNDGGCTFMGGSWRSPGTCAALSGQGIHFAFDDVGFRCCGP